MKAFMARPNATVILLGLIVASTCGSCAAPQPSTQAAHVPDDALEPVARRPGPGDELLRNVRFSRARAVTRGPKHHFFGYYGISPWNPSETLMVGLESGFHKRLPRPGEAATIGLIDVATGEWTPVAETRAWNFQQGCMLHWLSHREIIYNDRRDGRLVAVILDVVARQERKIIDRPIGAVDRRGTVALSFNFARMGRIRKVVGTAGTQDPTAGEPHPADDGIYRIDLKTGQSELIVSLDAIYRCRPLPPERESEVWINHVLINPDATRFLAIVRRSKRWYTLMVTAGMDGSGLRCVLPPGTDSSHFDWVSRDRILATFRPDQRSPRIHHMIADRSGDIRAERLGDGVLDYDGHCCVAPCGRWMITDSYRFTPERVQQLLLFDLKTGRYRVLGLYPQAPVFKKVRCDLHPRWSPSGRQICFDSTHGEQRQMYVIDIDLPG